MEIKNIVKMITRAIMALFIVVVGFPFVVAVLPGIAAYFIGRWAQEKDEMEGGEEYYSVFFAISVLVVFYFVMWTTGNIG